MSRNKLGRNASVVCLTVFLLLGQAKAKDYHFYIVAHGISLDPFWTTVKKAMNDAAALLTKGTEDKVEVTYKGPVRYSVEKFVGLLEETIAAGPDGLAVTITDPAAVDKPLRRSIDLGIPVIAINVSDFRPAEERIPYLFYVGVDEYLAGKKAAQRILALRKPKRAVVPIHEVSHIGSEHRAKGFIEVMNTRGVPVEKLTINLNSRTQTIEILGDYFADHPDTDCIFSLGAIDSEYTLQFLKEEGLDEKVLHAGFDVSKKVIRAIKEGRTIFTISQQQYLQGFLPVFFLYYYAKYHFLPAANVLTGPRFVDPSNVDTIENLTKQGYW